MTDATAHDRVGLEPINRLTVELDPPLVGSRIPEIAFSNVVLPAPLAPSTATIAPRGTDSDTPRMAVIGPYAASMLLRRRMVSTAGFGASTSTSEIGVDHGGVPLTSAGVPVTSGFP